jgi:hypothetical protein
MKKWIILSLALLMGSIVYSQELTYGFKAGLGYSQIHGDSEVNGGKELESHGTSSGFHIGAILNLKFIDNFGLRSGISYAQRGTKYNYEGPSHYFLSKQGGGYIPALGDKDMSLQVSSGFLEIPLLVFGKFGPFEFSGGFNAGLQLTSTARGSLKFTNGITTTLNTSVPSLDITLDHNYFQDKPRLAKRGLEPISIEGNGINVPLAQGGYYDFDSKGKNYYKSLDFSAVGGLSFYLNEGLFIGVQAFYSLTDVTNNEYDISQVSLDSNNEYIQRSDDDRYLNIAFSLGFSF